MKANEVYVGMTCILEDPNVGNPEVVVDSIEAYSSDLDRINPLGCIVWVTESARDGYYPTSLRLLRRKNI